MASTSSSSGAQVYDPASRLDDSQQRVYESITYYIEAYVVRGEADDGTMCVHKWCKVDSGSRKKIHGACMKYFFQLLSEHYDDWQFQRGFRLIKRLYDATDQSRWLSMIATAVREYGEGRFGSDATRRGKANLTRWGHFHQIAIWLTHRSWLRHEEWAPLDAVQMLGEHVSDPSELAPFTVVCQWLHIMPKVIRDEYVKDSDAVEVWNDLFWWVVSLTAHCRLEGREEDVKHGEAAVNCMGMVSRCQGTVYVHGDSGVVVGGAKREAKGRYGAEMSVRRMWALLPTEPPQ